MSFNIYIAIVFGYCASLYTAIEGDGGNGLVDVIHMLRTRKSYIYLYETQCDVLFSCSMSSRNKTVCSEPLCACFIVCTVQYWTAIVFKQRRGDALMQQFTKQFFLLFDFFLLVERLNTSGCANKTVSLFVLSASLCVLYFSNDVFLVYR